MAGLFPDSPKPAALKGVALARGRGEVLAAAAGLKALAAAPHLLCHAAFIAERLGQVATAPRGDIRAAREQKHFDVAELFAFVCPARFATPTPAGLARALALEPDDDDTVTLELVRDDLLARLGNRHYPLTREAAETATFLARANWPWARAVIEALLKANPKLDVGTFATGLNVWDRVEEWEDDGGRPPGRHDGVTPEEAQRLLAVALGSDAESRTAQRDYAAAATFAFAPRQTPASNNILLAEAGTGLGKTLGYLAPAYAFARKNNAPVWISTYTKNLQRQLDQETCRLVPEPEERRSRIVIRKGRENYVCLLNLQEVFGRLTSQNPRSALLAALIARWARVSRDGDMVGGDFPSWLFSLFSDVGLDGEGRAISPGSLGLTDRRGECIYAACPHYRKCFIERSVRGAAQTDIVIANHALVMINAARGRDEGGAPTRLILDEAHHIFDAADSTFATALTGQETIELRRWVIGPEGSSRGRRRGLSARLADVASYDAEGAAAINQARDAASLLPADEWLKRVVHGEPFGPVEALLTAVRAQVFARAEDGKAGDADAGYGLETELAEPDGALVEAAMNAAAALDGLLKPLNHLGKRLETILADGPDWMDGPARARIEGAIGSLTWRTDLLAGWIALLARVGGPGDPDFVDWLAVERFEGREFDIGLHRHWLDPTRPFAETVLRQAHGALLTSATLRGGGDGAGWARAEARTGAAHVDGPVQRFEAASPFDYAAQSEILIVTDVKRGDISALSAAYARLIEASNGGALGLFTAIRRLRAVHARIADRLARANLPLYAQHVDPIDTGTLVDIFRDDLRASLLGTDALRDGVDVPGHSLRLLIMEGVPWPKPTVLHAARKLAAKAEDNSSNNGSGGSAYDDAIIRARLAQAFGRLIRRADDNGLFVILSAAMPSRFLSAFPPGVPIRRITLDEAVITVSERLGFATSLVHQGVV